MERNAEGWLALAKQVISWLLVALGSLTAAKVAMYLAIFFTASQLYWGWRRYFRETSNEQL
jgi:hypothetical protein